MTRIAGSRIVGVQGVLALIASAGCSMSRVGVEVDAGAGADAAEMEAMTGEEDAAMVAVIDAGAIEDAGLPEEDGGMPDAYPPYVRG
jgi:hypothetical protein